MDEELSTKEFRQSGKGRLPLLLLSGIPANSGH